MHRRHPSMHLVIAVLALSCDLKNAALAIDFAKDVAPILETRCVRCHSGEKSKGGLSLSTKSGFVKGGDSGVIVVPGKPGESEIVRLVSGIKPAMPAEGPPLSAREVAVLREWITAGAEWPETLNLRERAVAGGDWWAVRPVQRPVVPAGDVRVEGQAGAWSRNEIDRFVAAKMVEVGQAEDRRTAHLRPLSPQGRGEESKRGDALTPSSDGLTPSPEADRRTLIRRLSFDLHGLPPTPDEVAAFEGDRDPRAYEALVDRLLESPHYGERWARHWLDVAHYADTHGFERDQRRDQAWRYRDWVIRAINADQPYDEFLRDQIAGDVLRPDDPAAVIATGFLAAGPWDFVGQAETKSEVLKRAARADDLDDLVTQVMTAACGVTVNCARCHDHKLDPIPTRDYYGLWAVFAGVKRGERDVSPSEVRELAARKQSLNAELQLVRREQARLSGRHFDLADIVGGGDGLGTGKLGDGIDSLTGKPQSTKRGFVEGVQPNVFVKSSVKFIEGVVIPDKSDEGTPISSTGLRVKNVPKTSGQIWDAIRFGPVNSQFSTTLDGTDFATGDHTLLSLHANAAITFDLKALREASGLTELRFTATAGYFGETPKNGASFLVYVDGEAKAERKNIGRDDGGIAVEVSIPATALFLTLMATDGGNGIGHDQICFADPWLLPAQSSPKSDEDRAELARLKVRRAEIEQQLASLPAPARLYGVLTETPPVIKVLARGNPEQPAEEVAPSALSSIAALPADFGTSQATDADRRKAFAKWVTSPANPLTRRVIVNRLWHHHFGTGLVETPSDFGLGGGRPSHPELLDWLAEELLERRWSLKSMHRLICTSATYRQQSGSVSKANTETNAIRGRDLDAGNRLLWRMTPRRLDAESLRDAVLTVSGKLNRQMFGPGYRDFEYQEEYAPVYRYITADSPDLWRRSVYRFAVRTSTHPFLTTLDCPSPANLVPARNVTTTALQSLALLNNDFILRQSDYFAQRILDEARLAQGTDAVLPPAIQVTRAFQIVFGRQPTPPEATAAQTLLESRGLPVLCRMLLNANEFAYVD